MNEFLNQLFMKKSLFIFAFAMTLPFWAKSQYYNYAPNTLNIPCFAQKGDAGITIGWGRGDAFQALELQGVYSPLPHLAVMANYFSARISAVRTFADQGTDSYFWEAGLGAYEQMPKGSASLFAGYGAGSLFSNYQPGANDLNSTLGLRRWFLQPGLAYRSNFFQAALALRLSRLDYSRGEVSFSIESPYLDYIRNVENDAPFFLPELGLQAGIRIKPITVSLSITSVFPNTDNLNFARLNANLSVGIGFSTGRKKGDK